MKIIQVNTVCSLGSTGKIVVDISNELLKSGNECKVLYGQYSSNYSEAVYIGNKIENLFHNICSRLFDRQAGYSKNNTRRLIDFVDTYKPDLIHLHNLHGNYLNIEQLFKYLSEKKLPIVWTLHDCWAFTGHCAYFDFVNCSKWKNNCYNCPNIKAYPPSFFLDNSKANFFLKKELYQRISNLHIVTPSKWLSDLASESILYRCSRHVIPNGIRTDKFIPTKTNLRNILGLDNNIILLGVAMGGFKGRKGLNYFIELSNSLPQNYKIILIGVTKEDLKLLPQNIIAIKGTNDLNELVEYYSLADMFINPTLEDNFPTTNLEALSCGTPVISFRTGGSHESIDENTGIIVDKGDINGLINAVLFMNNAFKKEKSLLCRERAILYYDISVASKEYISLYNKILRNI